MARTSTPSQPAPEIVKPVALGPGLPAASQRSFPKGHLTSAKELGCLSSSRPELCTESLDGSPSPGSTAYSQTNLNPHQILRPVGCYRFSCKTREAAPKLVKGRVPLRFVGSARGVCSGSITVASMHKVKCSGRAERGCVPMELCGRLPCTAHNLCSLPFPWMSLHKINKVLI